jgi:hypothetical protein
LPVEKKPARNRLFDDKNSADRPLSKALPEREAFLLARILRINFSVYMGEIMLKLKSLAQTLFVFTVVFAAFSFAQAQNPADRAVIAEAERYSGDRFGFMVNSPKGARVYGVRRPSAQMLAAIDQGLTDLFAVARKNRYTRRLNYSDYVIFIASPDRQKSYEGNYSPDIAIGVAQYAGTDVDKGGYMYVAGMVLGYNPNAFMVGEHTRDFNRAADVVRYEGEHIVLFHNDRRRYNETMDHSRGGAHPILQ